ncbi:hypothetical protein KAFR_0H01770 [Kazachstania africana CBS 2517]|uniref:F-box domain-containing protein n=1 Tax=Kazachstania africana (strain ATCC 22294 / BCRC 22015 / CBS 2517 / CECT 1963 / NBRC 1671 / NRRL Y-8276) TaxID=1071382 RepID=H2AZ31_KAZAF|nr:hypothetical protein KAFR_0H01770 [Kazachstania africana CBS 2517]CCF59587.1 hypothetical protein KAFR_0H01770 [Kazachstania africana CBS 2517]
MSLASLPDDVLGRIVSSTGRAFCGVSKRLYRIHNEIYRHKILQLFEVDHPIWDYVIEPLEEYLQDLDPLRKPARCLLSNGLSQNCNYDLGKFRSISHSWHIVYSVLLSINPIRNIRLLRTEPFHESLIALPYHLPLGRVPFNVWIALHGSVERNTIRDTITLLKSTQSTCKEEFFMVSYIEDWIKEPGLYCIRLGYITQSLINSCRKRHCEYLPFIINTSLANYDTSKDKIENVELVGYDFGNYSHINAGTPWIFMQTEVKYKNYICTSSQTVLNAKLYEFSSHNSKRDSCVDELCDETATILTTSSMKIPVKILSKYPKYDSGNDEHVKISNPSLPRLIV